MSIKQTEHNYNFIEDLSDGEVLDLIFAKFDIKDVDNATEQLLRKIDKLLEGTNG